MTYPGEEYPYPWELAIELDLVKIVRDLIITSSGRGKREIFKYFLLIFFTIWSSPYWFSFPTIMSRSRGPCRDAEADAAPGALEEVHRVSDVEAAN